MLSVEKGQRINSIYKTTQGQTCYSVTGNRRRDFVGILTCWGADGHVELQHTSWLQETRSVVGLNRTAVWANRALNQGPKSAAALMGTVKACWNRIMKASVFIIIEASSKTLDVTQLLRFSFVE